MATWPASLPQVPITEGYGETPSSQVLRSEMSIGPPKTRRRTTASTRSIPVSYLMDGGQVETFESWFDTDIAAGALPFDWPNPRTSDVQSVMITGDEPYQITPSSTGVCKWVVSMTIQVQP